MLNLYFKTYPTCKYQICLLIAGLLCSTHSLAAPQPFFGENQLPSGTVSGDPATARANFLAALSGGVGTEDFEAITSGTSSPIS